MRSRVRVAIVQPAVPSYREPFFELLIERGRSVGIDIDVFSGEVPVQHKHRGDTRSTAFVRQLPSREFTLGNRSLFYRSTKEILNGNYQLVVVEHAVRNMETYSLIAHLGRKRVAFWGHGRTYTKKVPRTQENIKLLLARHAAWYFAYTEGGAQFLSKQGVEATKMTVLNNSIDTTNLGRLIDEVDDRSKKDFSDRYDLRGKTAIFVGALDAPKRLPFLIESADILQARMNDFRLLIVGAGEESQEVVAQAASRPWMRVLGPLLAHDKALALSASEVIAMPGRVGLVAVDSFAASTPIVTTDWPWHAPEFEYLENGVNAIVANDNPVDYSRSLEMVLDSRELLSKLREGASNSARDFSIEAMAENFLNGLVSWGAATRTLALD